MTPQRVPSRHVRTAELWHGGQWCPLYSVCSTGFLHDPEGVVAECDRILRKEPTEMRDVIRLRFLRNWAARFVPVEEEA